MKINVAGFPNIPLKRNWWKICS